MATQKNQDKKLEGGITQAQLDQWKEQYEGEVYKIKVPDEKSGKTHLGYVTTVKQKRDRNIYARAASLYNADQIVEAAEFVFANTWLGGDEKLRSDDWLRSAAALECMNYFQLPKAESEKA